MCSYSVFKCMNLLFVDMGMGVLTYKSDRSASTDASNQGAISDNFLAKIFH